MSPVTYVSNLRSEYLVLNEETGEETFDEESYKLGTKRGHRRQAGFLAQDAYQAMIDTYEDDNYAALVD